MKTKLNTYAEPAREIPVAAEVDVLVAGGGPAGFGAAVAAARAGASVLLVEQSGSVGGVATTGLMSHWTSGGAEDGAEGPVLDELLDRARDAEKDVNYHADKILRAKYIINPDKVKLTMLAMLEEAGVRLRLHTMTTEPIAEAGRVRGAVLESKSGREAVFAKVVVDATGDGDLAYRAGAAFTLGRDSDNGMQPMTVMFKVAGVDAARAVYPGEFEDNIEVPAGRLQDLGRERLPQPTGHVLLYPSSLPGVVTVNMTNCIGVDGTDIDDITRAEIACRRQIPVIVDFLRKYVPGYERCFLITTAESVGVRETRHFKGLCTVTEEDIESARVFDDWIATRNFFNFDIHNLDGSGLDAAGAQNEFRRNGRYTLPYGAFVPEKIDGLLLAGRSISGTHKAHSSYRAMAICVNMGQGAGAAAALCAAQGVQPRELAVADIQAELIRQGVRI